jgi:mRNA-degrading endonuclease RelE of RelBE toxin-antitoxin system
VTAPYALVVAPRAARALSDDLPEAAAWAVIELISGPLLEHPHRLGHQLRNELTGIWSARRGDFRVLYTIDERACEVTVLRVEHRRDVYRT